tara:strand:- start:400 stop:744 length:345 start_codon:yes stop_codon:yes gene_type:complete
MSNFSSRDEEQLRKLAKDLPKTNSIHTPNEISKKQVENKFHSLENEKDPENLFKSLMEISPDGKIPKHLIKLTKELESKNHGNKTKKENLNNLTNKENKELYVSFKQLLLEEDD